MEKPKNNDHIFFYSKIDRIWKSSEKTPPKITIHFLVKQCVTGEFIGAGIDHTEKIISKPRGLLLVL
jgi:hypothetical protein